MVDEVVPGHRLFARYAQAPNALGYCGPEGAAGLRAVAAGAGAGVDVPDLARQFSGAWPYQQVLAELAGRADPLEEEVVRGYWTGNKLTDSVDPQAFGAALLARIKPQAGHYWAHLTDDLVGEAAPTHAFHVLSVYPWTRLLPTGRPEPLQVLESCRVGWARVEAVDGPELVVCAPHLEYDEGRLTLGVGRTGRIGHHLDGVSLTADVLPGDYVAVHWGNACERLDPEQVDVLRRWTQWQLDAIAPRLAADYASSHP